MKHDLNHNFQRRARRLYALFACLVLTLPVAVVPALAADDPLAVVTSLSDFIFSLIRAVGLILLGYGILQVGLSLQSHDPSQPVSYTHLSARSGQPIRHPIHPWSQAGHGPEV